MSESYSKEASQHLLTLARHNAEVYISQPEARAAILTGSSAEGVSDFYSDIDMIVYYDKLPSEKTLLAACEQNRGKDRKYFGEVGQEECMEIYQVGGVECQIIHTTIAAWERDMATVLEHLDVASLQQKALSGMLIATPLYGETLVRKWQAMIASYPDALAEAMVKHYLAITPVWAIYERMESRDGTIWLNQLLVEGSYHVLGILAGLNHLYYSPFQFKRMHHFIASMNIAPPNTADRLEALFHSDLATAATQLEVLVQEVVHLVEQHMPNLDVSPLREKIGRRLHSWQPL